MIEYRSLGRGGRSARLDPEWHLSTSSRSRDWLCIVSTLDPYKPPAARLDDPAGSATGAVACPKCGASSASKVSFTWWGGALGPRLFHVMRCQKCRAQFNGRTGASLGKVIVVYQLSALALAAVLFGLWAALRRR